MIKYSEKAAQRVKKAIEANGEEGLAFRIQVVGVSAKGFRYDYSLDKVQYKQTGDEVIEADGFSTLIDSSSLKKMQGATIDWVEDELGSADFAIDNPNNPKLDLKSPVVQKLIELFEKEINPAVASHGGVIDLVDVQGNRVYVALGGGCQGCGQANVTLKQGIEQTIKENLPEITEVVDTTDHASGTNPYYA